MNVLPPADDEPGAPEFVVSATPIPPRRGWRAAVVPIAFVFVALVGGSALFMAGFALGSQRATSAGTPTSLQEEFAPFWEAYWAITQQYVGTVDQKALVEGAIGGLFQTLNDPYSGYLTPEQYRASLQTISGRFEGIGAEVGTKATNGSVNCTPISETCQMVVIAPLEGSPAAAAGLKAGDVFLAIDGASPDGLTLDQAIAKVRGPRGTNVTFLIQRAGSPASIEITVTRDVIVTNDVTSKTLAGGTVGYLRIVHFSENVGKDFHAQLKTLLDQGIKSFVLDLRDDPGGFVPQAVAVASEFVPAGRPLFWEEYAGGKANENDATAGGLATDTSVKVVVLINGGTASASEIVAAALSENGRATLVGTPTYGKGLVQVWQLLSNDAGGFRLTIAKWLTPEKNYINKNPIKPDVLVSTEGAVPGTDPVLDKGVALLTSGSAGRVTRPWTPRSPSCIVAGQTKGGDVQCWMTNLAAPPRGR